MELVTYIAIALTQTATIYGFGEKYCGDPATPTYCDSSATTASGEGFDPDKVTAAVPIPTVKRLRTTVVGLKVLNGPCVRVRINDKKHERYVGSGGLDLSPGAVRQLTGSEPSPLWSGKLFFCEVSREESSGSAP